MGKNICILAQIHLKIHVSAVDEFIQFIYLLFTPANCNMAVSYYAVDD